MADTRQVIHVTVDSETSSPVTADRIQKMLRDRFSHSRCVADPLNKDQGIETRLKAAVENMRDGLKQVREILTEEGGEDNPVFSAASGIAVSLLMKILELSMILSMRDQFSEFMKNIHPGMNAGDLLRVAVGGDLKALNDEMIDTMPEHVAHSIMHVLGDMKKLETPCDKSPAEVKEWLKEHIKPNPKEVS